MTLLHRHQKGHTLDKEFFLKQFSKGNFCGTSSYLD